MLNRNGQTLVEYLKDSITKMSCSMVGKEYVESNTIGKAYCKGDEDKLFE